MNRSEQHLVLVGMMGVGKSTIGRALADRLDREMIDSDSIIEARTGRTVREIFADDGEPAFRALESEVLLEALSAPHPLVIAAAGGVVLSATNRAALRRPNARVVWLCADPATLLERVRHGVHRPLLDDDPAGTLQRMFVEREGLYREVADTIVLVDHRSVGEVVEAVLR
ncbi:MAG TPA: shikimate kinase [Ilumatobacteraceae bacterium]|nr:shikimate kinase [Ilumatobacteraceae bacterium]